MIISITCKDAPLSNQSYFSKDVIHAFIHITVCGSAALNKFNKVLLSLLRTLFFIRVLFFFFSPLDVEYSRFCADSVLG